MKQYKGYIFDFDLTLADSRHAIVSCFRCVFDEYGIPAPSDDEIASTIGMTLPDSFRKLLPDRPGSFCDECAETYIGYSSKMMTGLTGFYPETEPLLEALRAAGRKIGIMSTKRRFRIMEALDAHGLTGHIDTVFGMEDVSKVKPDPEGLLKLLDVWGMDKSEALYVGDTVIDGLAAKNAGLDFAAVTTGTTKAEAFQDIPHVAVMPDLSGLTSAVLRAHDGKN